MSISSMAAAITISVIDANSAATVQEINQELTSMGEAGLAGGAAAAEGLDQVGTHALTSLDNVRLLRDDLGIRIPRAMEKAIASSSLLSGAIGALGSGFIALGAVEIIGRMATSIYDLYEKWIDVEAAADEYTKTVKKNQDADFINVRSIEDAKLRIDEATSAMTNAREAAQALHSAGVAEIFSGDVAGGAGMLAAAHSAAASSVKSGEQANALDPKQIELQHQLNLEQIEANHATDGALQGQAKITAELQKQLAIHAEDQKYTRLQDRLQGNLTSPDSGQALQDAKDREARGKAAADEIELARTTNEEIIKLHNEAVNSELQGSALYTAQEQQAIDELIRKGRERGLSDQQIAQETAAVKEKFDNEEAVRLNKLWTESQQQLRTAQTAGLTGVAKIQADQYDRMQQINTNPESSENPAAAENLRVAANLKADQEITAAQQQFNERMNELSDSSGNYMISGYAKISAEARKHIDELEKLFREYYGQLAADDPLRVAAEAQVQAQITQIDSQADRERQQLHQKTMNDLTKEEQLAARDLMPPWQAAQQNIVDQYNDRVKKAQDALNQELASNKLTATQLQQVWREYFADVEAAGAVEAAALEKQAMETRDKMASSLSELFKNPASTIEKDAEDLMMKILANWLMQSNVFKGQFGGILNFLLGGSADLPTTGSLHDQLGAVFGSRGSAGGSMSTLSSAGTTLNTAGGTLSTAANAQLAAASALQSASTQLSMGSGSGGPGGLEGLFNLGDGGSDSSSIPAGGIGFGFTPGLSSGGSGLGNLEEADPTAGQGTSALTSSAGTLGGGGNKYLGAAGAAITGGIGLYNAYENSDPLGGALSGAMSGAAIGSMFGPEGTVIGALVGGVAGLVAGLFGDKGAGKAKDYDKNTVQPELQKDMEDYDAGRTGYNQVAKDFNDLMTSAQSQTASWGSGARSWYDNHIKPEISAALTSLNQQEADGRGQITMSAAEYHTGGWIGDFGNFRTSDNEGFIHAMEGEFMVHPAAAAANAPLLQAINSGSRFSSYAGGGRMTPAGSNGGAQVSLTVQALDAQSVKQWMQRGGARTIIAGINQGQKQYAGVGRG